MADRERVREGKLVEEADEPSSRSLPTSPSFGFLSSMAQFVGRISGLNIVNRWNTTRLKHAQELIEARTSFVQTYRNHQEVLDEFTELPEILETKRELRRTQRAREVEQVRQDAQLAKQNGEAAIKVSTIQNTRLDRELESLQESSHATETRHSGGSRWASIRQGIIREGTEYVKTREEIRAAMNRELERFKQQCQSPPTYEEEQETRRIQIFFEKQLERLDS